jgi:hypothetical protein
MVHLIWVEWVIKPPAPKGELENTLQNPVSTEAGFFCASYTKRNFNPSESCHPERRIKDNKIYKNVSEGYQTSTGLRSLTIIYQIRNRLKLTVRDDKTPGER